MDKEDDRVRHIEALNAQTGPVFLAHRAGDVLDKFIAGKRSRESRMWISPSSDGVRHTSWTISNADEIKFITRTFAAIQQLYIADGHHRSAAAARGVSKSQRRGRQRIFSLR